jgi:hypothetical protein
LTLLGALAACDAPRGTQPAQVKAEEKEVELVLSQQQVYELTEQCGKKSREEFRRAWNEGTVKTADGQMTAEFTNHYNVRLNSCFYLLTVSHYTAGSDNGSASASTLNKMLFDINEGERYGEYLGPATDESPPVKFPETCKVVSLNCASRREWEVLAGPYMED